MFSLTVRTQCLVEWNELGKLVSVVLLKSVSCQQNENHERSMVGDACTDTVRQGTKKVEYSAKILGVGKTLSDTSNVMCIFRCVLIWQVVNKRWIHYCIKLYQRERRWIW